ncbi:hypothetical protein MC7420_1204 [Coleofasciculus chthonoplastes PCC 7420]|uniref:Uncharacterized protein n=1 Tax=Coleofasciculus chthonoplastes PCC 7420 TaxID=118168 RepID=B4VXQ9_9CYAN|nr:hypothetical protein MC7420_1204 [Coleofasciculus chthonoplastes PCC 7420]
MGFRKNCSSIEIWKMRVTRARVSHQQVPEAAGSKHRNATPDKYFG